VEHDDEHRRAAGRRDWPIEVHRLDASRSDSLSTTTTAQQRLAMMWPLALEAWRVSGTPIPDYTRSEIPSRVIRAYRSGATDRS
jgi:hypothetical protein